MCVYACVCVCMYVCAGRHLIVTGRNFTASGRCVNEYGPLAHMRVYEGRVRTISATSTVTTT